MKTDNNSTKPFIVTLDRTATYVWSFDIPTEDVKSYCEEIRKEISGHPHRDTDTVDDYCAFIASQSRNYLENELSLRKKVKVFPWFYVGQTTQSAPFKRWTSYYRKKSSQCTLNFPMFILTKRNVLYRLSKATC